MQNMTKRDRNLLMLLLLLLVVVLVGYYVIIPTNKNNKALKADIEAAEGRWNQLEEKVLQLPAMQKQYENKLAEYDEAVTYFYKPMESQTIDRMLTGMVASSLVGVVAQRLMRKLCPACATTRKATAEEKLVLGRDVETVPVAKGCSACSFTGYKGRMAIHEIFMVDANIRRLITERASADEIKAYAMKEQGMVLLQDAAAQKVREGVTTMEELMKVAYFV